MRLVPLALGLAAVVLGAAAHFATSPTAITWGGRDYAIVTRIQAEAECFDFVSGDTTAFSLCGSLDTLCERPEAYVFDANGDGEDDVVVDTCSGRHVVSRRGGAIGEQRVETLHPGWWGRQVLDGGTELLVVGVVLVIVGLGTLVIRGALD